MRRAPDLARLSMVAGDQLGLFTRAHAAECGLNREHLRRLVERGVILRVTPRVLRFSSVTGSVQQDVLAACLDGGPECVASHRTAAALHGFHGCRTDIVEVLVPMHV